MEIKEVSRKEYDDFLKNVSHYSFLQTSQMNEVLISNGRKTKLLALVDNGEIYAVALAFIRNIFQGERMDLMVGASSITSEYEYVFYDCLKDYVKGSDVLRLVIKLDHDYLILDSNGEEISIPQKAYFDKMKDIGYIENDGSIQSYDGSPDFQYVKNLTEYMPNDYKKLLKSFNKNAQRKIKKAIELQVKVRKIHPDEMEEFKKITLETAERQEFGDKSLEYYKTFYNEFNEACEFLVAEIDLKRAIEKINKEISDINPSSKNKQRLASLEKDLDMLEEIRNKEKKDKLIIANMILVYTKKEVIYFLGGSLTDYQKLAGAFLLQYEAMKITMDRNISIYNFFGIDGVFDGSDGVLRFKQNFNGHIVNKTGAFIYYPNPIKYKAIETLKRLKRNIQK